MMKGKVIVLDDDPIIVSFVDNVLSQKGLNVVSASNGKDGMNIILKEKPDLVIMDWEMPSMTGIEVLGTMKNSQELKDIPVIIITGRIASSDDLKEALDSGAIDFIRKPIEPVELIARTKSALALSTFYKDSLRKKNWELTLLSKTNYQNKLVFDNLLSIADRLYEDYISIGGVKHKDLQKEVNTIKNNLKNNSWEILENYFSKVHPHFSTNLLKAFPKITPEEIRLSYFLKMNMRSKEIAALTNKEIHSVDIARYRLRKKLKIDKSVKINAFLSKF